MDYNKCDEENLKILHKKIIKSETSMTKLGLLIKAERGRFYHTLKIAKPREWQQFCRVKLSVCHKTANRYIEFYQLSLVYPRLLATDLNFEAIMSQSKQLITYLKKNEELSGRLMVPLKDTIIFGKEFQTSNLFDEPKSKYLKLSSAEFKWTANWFNTNFFLKIIKLKIKLEV
jgi:hypothetical protein